VLEVNPNPYLLPSAEFSMAAKQSGREYVDMVNEIVEDALTRYGVTARNGNGRGNGGWSESLDPDEEDDPAEGPSLPGPIRTAKSKRKKAV